MDSDSSDSDTNEQEAVDYDENRWRDWDNRHRQEPLPDNITVHVSVLHNNISPWNKKNDGITTLYRCNATDAKVLYIFDSAHKLQQNNQYDIGGAYSDNDAKLWFFFTTSAGPGRIYLMNIFVCQRHPGIFSLGISDANTLITTVVNNERVRTLNSELHWQNFHSTQPDEIHYVKTIKFSEEDRISLQSFVFVIPISIDMSPKSILKKEVIHKIKTDLDFGEKLFEDQEHDFTVKSNEGKEFRVHKILLAAHSPKLRDMIRAEDCISLSLNVSNNEVERLLQYLYTGAVKDILNQQLEGLLMLADQFELHNLNQLVYYAMKLSINSGNALSIAVIAEKYNYDDIQEVAFRYIAHHPELLDSDAFTEIDDANVVKKLLKYIHGKSSHKTYPTQRK